MKDDWKPPMLPMIITMMCLMPVIVIPFAWFLLGPLPPLVWLIILVVLLVPGIQFAVIYRWSRDLWGSQRRFINTPREGLADLLEAALREAGLEPSRRSLGYRPGSPPREVLDLKGGIAVSVISFPTGHVIYAGPYRDETRRDVERAKGVVDKALDGSSGSKR